VNPEQIPVYAVRLSAAAAAQTATALEWMKKTAGEDTAEEWEEGLHTAWASLATLPARYPIAEENRFYQKKHIGPPLLVALYRHGRSTWRLLFTIQEANSDDPATVVIRQFRNAAQKPLTKWPDEG